MLEWLKHGRLQVFQWLLSQPSPHVMSKVEQTIPVDLRFGDIKVGTNERDQDGIKNVVDKLMK